ncbi:unnamed protein product [Toxocara canis]|uniref:Protein TFG n=1 Tax=Toxocara canis TaxID=6265 RepID=A0A183UMY7_TOXCA|nr:unnamed protein product [Toxocara canis]
MVHNGGEVEATMVKARYGSDIRKMTVHHNDDLSYNDLVMMMQRIFKIKSANNISLKYKDQEGDLITMVDDHDLLLALQNEPSLSLVVLTELSEAHPLNKLQGELETIRDAATALLDMLKKMGQSVGDHPVLNAINDRPDTPNLLNESVATIQPSVHEQVNNGIMAMSHPPAPCAPPDAPPMDISASIRGAFETGASGESTGTVPPAPKCDDTHTHSEPTSEVDISSGNQHISTGLTPVPHQTGARDHNEPSAPMTTASESVSKTQAPMCAPLPAPAQPPAPAAPTPVYAFGQSLQATAPPTSATSTSAVVPGVPPGMPTIPTPAAILAAPAAPFGASVQFGAQQQHPPPPPQQFGALQPQFQQLNAGSQQNAVLQQQQPPQVGFAPVPSTTPGIPSTPTSTQSAFGVPPAGTPTLGAPAVQQQPQMPPPPVSQMSLSSSTPTPTASAYPQSSFRTGTPSYGSTTTPVPHQQPVGGASPPSMMPPTGAPPIMPFSTAQGVNPFGRGAGHYPRMPYSAGFQQ